MPGPEKQTAHDFHMGRTQKIIPGDDLLSHTLARAVPLALGGLTAVFGMGTGVSPPLQSPENSKLEKNKLFEAATESGWKRWDSP